MARCLSVGLVAVLVCATVAGAGCQRSEEPSDYIPLLASPKEETQRRAIDELIRMQKKAVPAVQQALRSEDALVRTGALKVLAKMRRMDSVTAAGEMIHDPELAVQRQAITTLNELAQVWKEKSVEYLAQALELPDPVCVRTAAEALAAMDYRPATEVLRKTFEAGQGIKAVFAARLLYEMEPSPETTQLMLEKLRAPDAQVREAAVVSIYGKENADDPTKLDISGLRDRIVGPLVEYVDTAPNPEAAREVLIKVRESLIYELERILDSKRAARILEALGTIADEECVEKLKADLVDTRLESAWRVAAANALGIAGMASRVRPAVKMGIIQELTDVVDNAGQDKRVPIGAAIALCRLKQANGVRFLLDELARFEEAISAGTVTEARRQDLTALRIRAQEALTQSGDFVVPYLMEKMKDERDTRELTAEQRLQWEKRMGRKAPGNFIAWAAAKTMGELGVQEAIPYLGAYATEQVKPLVTIDEQGHTSATLELTNPDQPDEAELAARQEQLEIFAYPDYVRLTAAIALGKMAGKEARDFLAQAERAETDLLARLEANKKTPDYYKRAPIIENLIRRHEDVLFYVRLAQEGIGAE